MIKVETAYHFITSDNDDLPKYACKGKCKSVWWDDEEPFDDVSILQVIYCPKCGGPISGATEKDYKIIDQGKVTHIPYTMVVHSKHEVKPEYEEMAKREWC